ncbi:MAG: DUF4149 domain-containing protein [Mariprofundaceae bacterium]|nr:DUF4149 domain-containing protein [Mariprofundaceae bacterium]
MKQLHHGLLLLSLSLLLGLLIVPAYVVAPILFQELDSHQAGIIAGKIFHLANPIILILCFLIFIEWRRMQASIFLWASLCLLAFCIGMNEFMISPVLQDIKAQAGPINLLNDDDPMRSKFFLIHGCSAVLHLIASLCGLFIATRPAKDA